MSNELIQKREILVYNAPKQKFHVFMTTTNKWAELASLIVSTPELEVSDISKMRAVVGSTENTLELPDAQIPDGPQRIHLFEAKVKSGAKKDTTDYYETISFTDLRRLAKEKGVASGLGSNPTKEALISAIESASGIKTEKKAKETKTGKIRTVTIREESPETKTIVEKDKIVLANQPSLEDRQSALEEGFARLINGLYSLASDFVQPKSVEKLQKVIAQSKEVKEEPQGSLKDMSLEDLRAESSRLKLPR